MLTKKLPLLFIGHFGKPRAFAKKSAEQLGFQYRFNSKAWMTGVLFQEWIQEFDNRMRKADRKVLLLLDNAPSHVMSNLVCTNVKVLFLPPNTTSRIQPMDAGIIAAFKKRYRSCQLQRALDLDAAGSKDIFKVDILQGIRWALMAWNLLSPRTIHNCWKHSGVLGNDPLPVDFESDGDCEWDRTLADYLKCLHLENPIPLTEFVSNPDEDCEVHMVLSDDDIIEFVQGRVIDEPEEEDDQDAAVEIQPSLEHRIHILREAVVIMGEDPEKHLSCLFDLRTYLRDLEVEQRQKRQSSFSQSSIFQFFDKHD